MIMMQSRNAPGKRGYADVYQTLKDDIQYLRLMPGSVIRESDLIRDFGCSRTPIREALLRLSGEYLVDIYPQRGMYVSRIDFPLAAEVAYMRHILDSDICLSLCRQHTSLQSSVDEVFYFMSTAVKNRDVVRYIQMDNAFHRAIFTAAGRERIWSIISNSRAPYNRVLVLDLSMDNNLERSYGEHQKIAEYIETGNEEELRKILEVHHDHLPSPGYEEKIRAQFPQYFDGEA